MKRSLCRSQGLVLLAFLAIVAVQTPNGEAQPMHALPINNDALDKVVSAENLKAVAAKTTDAQVLLGLAFLAPAGSPARAPISEMAVKAKPEYAPIVAVLALTMDGIAEKPVAELIKRDPDNALGHYLQGNLLYQAGKKEEALAAFRKAAACPDIRLYESTTCEALFKALDALNLRGRERLWILSWMASRSWSFSATVFDPMRDTLSELAQNTEFHTGKEVSDLLMILAGQLYATNFANRLLAEELLDAVYSLKAEMAFAENSPMANAFLAARQTIFDWHRRWPGIEERRSDPLELAQFLPTNIHDALSVAYPSKANLASELELKSRLPQADKAEYEKAREKAGNAAKTFTDVAATDPDGILGAYFKGLPPRKERPAHGDVIFTFVERLMEERPEVFKAAATYRREKLALNEAGKNDPSRTNIARMSNIAMAVVNYAVAHDNNCPDSLAVLFENGNLEAPLEAKSLLTGKPYVYVAAGEKLPQKAKEMGEFILFYDDKALPDGSHQCCFADCHSEAISADKLKEHLKARGKWRGE